MKILFVFLIILTAFHSNGQIQVSQKIGHADWEYIFSQMPEYNQIENELRIFEMQLQNQLKTKSEEIEAKYKDCTSLPADTPEAIKKDKEAELLYLQENIQRFRQEAQISMQNSNDIWHPAFLRFSMT